MNRQQPDTSHAGVRRIRPRITAAGTPNIEVPTIDAADFDPHFEPVFPGVRNLHLRFPQRVLSKA